MQLLNITKSKIIAKEVEIADTLWTRYRGLLGRKTIPVDSVLIIKKCNQVHMYFMRFPIGAIFLGEGGKVLHKEHLKPWQVSKRIKDATCVVEVHPTLLANFDIGDSMMVTEVGL